MSKIKIHFIYSGSPWRLLKKTLLNPLLRRCFLHPAIMLLGLNIFLDETAIQMIINGQVDQRMLELMASDKVSYTIDGKTLFSHQGEVLGKLDQVFNSLASYKPIR